MVQVLIWPEYIIRSVEKGLQGILCPKAVTAKTIVLNLKKIQYNDWLFAAARWPLFLIRLFSQASLDFQGYTDGQGLTLV